MTLTRLRGQDFRCFEQFELSPDTSLNLIVGPNGAGKTSLLEAIYMLGRGRSFRAADVSSLRRASSRTFALRGELEQASRHRVVRITAGAGGLNALIDEEEAGGLAALAELLPVQVIEPGAHKLIEEGPGRRRRFLDWGVFHVEHHFLSAWRRYQRALRQRNAGLKQGASDTALAGFEAALAEHGEEVSRLRSDHVQALRPFLTAAARALLGEPVDCQYVPGWTSGYALAEALEVARDGDRRQQTTRIGPQRADLQIHLDGAPARERVSRGEQKLLAASLILAQIDLLAARERPTGILLVDDPAAELDRDRLDRLLHAVLTRHAQAFITALPNGIPGLPPTARRFHVEQGEVSKMV